MGLLLTFITALIGALVYQRRRRRDWGQALQFSIVFGLATMLFVFVSAIVLDGFGLLPTYPSDG